MGITDFSSQRPAIDVKVPALTRHLTFRLLKHENPRFAGSGENDDQQRRDGEWRSFLDGLERHLNELRNTFPIDNKLPSIKFSTPYGLASPSPGAYNPNRSAVLEVQVPDDFGFRLRVRVDVYTEIYSVSYIFDAIDLNTPSEIAKHLLPLIADAGRPARLAGIFGPKNLVPDEKAALDWLYNSFWGPSSPISICRIADVWAESPALRRGTLLADFRGVVIPPDRSSSPASTTLPDDQIAAVPGLATSLRHYIGRMGGVIRAATGENAQERSPLTSGEPVLCGMAGGAALYMAELGRQTPKPVEPVRHLLIYAGLSPAQIGRLVRRLHVLGEFRHAALMDYDNESSDDLKSVSRIVRALGVEVDQKLAGAVPGEDLIGGINRITKRIGDLKANKKEDGLRYRIE